MFKNCTKKTIIKIITFIFIIINFILCWFLLKKLKYDELISEYKNNWQMTPIKSIILENKTHFHFNKNEKNINNIQKRLGYFPGFKTNLFENLNEIKGGDITIWRNKQFIIELMEKKYYYYDLLLNGKDKKICGKDEKNNNLYFPDDEDCPINYINITDSLNDDNCINCTNINNELKSKKYLNLDNNQNNSKILVQFHLSNFNEFFKNCSKIDEKINKESNNIDNDEIYEVIKQNGYLLNYKYFISTNKLINLSYTSYFGIKKIDQKDAKIINKNMKNSITFPNYYKIKNIFVIILNLSIGFFFSLSFFSINYAGLLYLFVEFSVFTRSFISFFTIYRFGQISKIFKYIQNFEEYKKPEKFEFYRIEITIFVFDICIFVLIIFLFLEEKEIFEKINDYPIEISFLKGRNLKRIIKKTFCCEIEEPNEQTINSNLLIDDKLKEELNEAKNDENKLLIIYDREIENYKKEALDEGNESQNDKVKRALFEENSHQAIHFSIMNTNQLNFREEQNRGGFGSINFFQLNSTSEIFALKTANQETNENKNLSNSQIIRSIMNIKFLEREINFLKKLDHPNIIKYKGKRISDEKLQMVMEYAKGGSLFDLLIKKNQENQQLPIKFKFKLIKQLADALIYIHNQNIIHCDVKASNILLDKEYNDEDNPDNYPNLKLIDFGLSCNKEEIVPGYSLFYTAPEILKDENVKADTSLDVFIFGSVCYEILVQKRPFYDISSKYVIKQFIKKGKRPDLKIIKDNNYPNEFIDIIKNCWEYDPKNRCKMNEIMEKLNNINI